jgi:hypothetical protein
MTLRLVYSNPKASRRLAELPAGKFEMLRAELSAPSVLAAKAAQLERLDPRAARVFEVMIDGAIRRRLASPPGGGDG